MKSTLRFKNIFAALIALVLIAGALRIVRAEDRFDPNDKDGFFLENDDDFYDTQSCTIFADGKSAKSGNQALPKRADADGFRDLYSEDSDPAAHINPFAPPDPFVLDISFLPPKICIGSFALGFGCPKGGADLNQYAQTVKTGIQRPDVDVTFSPVNPEPGEDRVATANVQGLDSSSKSPKYLTWCVNGTSQQGLLAGGRKIDYHLGGVGEERNCCSPVTRRPQDEGDTDLDDNGVDANGVPLPKGDGMGDNWERAHFPGKTIEQIKPDADPDGDGPAPLTLQGRHCVNSGLNECTDVPRDGYLFISPYVYAYNDASKFYGVGENSGKLTNLEEYVWGTNPLNPDTNNDGVIDGDAIAGKDMTALTLKATDFPDNVPQKVRATVLGMSTNKIVKIDSEQSTVYPAGGAPLQMTVTPDQPVPTPGKPVILTARVQGARFGEAALNFQWEVKTSKGTLSCTNSDEVKASCGLGKNVLKLTAPINLAPQESFIVSATAFESFTAKEITTVAKLQNGSQQIAFDLAVCGDDSACAESSCDASKKNPNPDQYVRARVVPVTIPGLDLNNLAYAWRYDGAPVTDSRAAGQQLCVQALGLAHSTHPVELSVYGDAKEAISVSRQDVIIGGAGVGLQTQASANAVYAKAEPEQFAQQGKGAADFSYVWSVNGTQLDTKTPYLVYTLKPDETAREVRVSASIVGGGQSATATKTVALADRGAVGLSGKVAYNYLAMKYWLLGAWYSVTHK